MLFHTWQRYVTFVVFYLWIIKTKYIYIHHILNIWSKISLLLKIVIYEEYVGSRIEFCSLAKKANKQGYGHSFWEKISKDPITLTFGVIRYGLIMYYYLYRNKFSKISGSGEVFLTDPHSGWDGDRTVRRKTWQLLSY